ncbi:MAG: UvrD-helicase domain-containing protein, partial [Lachnospiraceae bacterium]|nr:UvrD-helicase domain-containing protein [Lachnospiraceae bacterium]
MGLLQDPYHPVDVDRILVLTFTRAAAAQMKQRLLERIQEYLIKKPNDANMQMQETLIHNAQITTIDSFCLYLVKNHFHRIGIDPGFRLLESGEETLLSAEVLRDVLEECFEKGEQDFLTLVDALNPEVKESKLESSIMDLHEYAQSYPWPDKWLETEQNKEIEQVVLETQKQLCTQVLDALDSAILMTRLLIAASLKPGYPAVYESAFIKDGQMLSSVRKAVAAAEYGQDAGAVYETVADGLAMMRWDRMPGVKKDDMDVDQEKKDQLSKLRGEYKDSLEDLRDLYRKPYEKMYEDEARAKALSDALIQVVRVFGQRLLEHKKEQAKFSFSDIEHFALDILYDDGVPSETALSYRELFEEIMVDEYQDSNQVQEDLLAALARPEAGRHNRFMVGDKKQSIYRFRMARPEIFMEKYHAYGRGGPDHERILLRKNFRSRVEVIDSVNTIFRRIMREEIGGIDYNTNEELVPGAAYQVGKYTQNKTELMLSISDEKGIRKRRAEAAMIADRIRDMLDKKILVKRRQIEADDAGTVQQGEDAYVYDEEGDETGILPGMRMDPRVRIVTGEIEYRDIVILVRSHKDFSPLLVQALSERGIPAHAQSSTGYYDTPEVAVVLDLLRAIDNPYSDIPLAGALKSMFFSFSDEDLALVRQQDKDISFYECLQKRAAGMDADERLASLAGRALAQLQQLRELASHITVSQLMAHIFLQFHYREYLLSKPFGKQRAMNADMLITKAEEFEKTSYHNLFWFIRYVEKLKKEDVNEGEAGILSEQANVVRIMTIHGSKGLEFPVVFMAGCDKGFNLSDSKGTILMDMERGIAADSIDTVTRIKTPSLRKRVLADQIRKDMLGEELRLLYVAATRAKEKLIFTATANVPAAYDNAYSYLKSAAGTAGALPADVLAKPKCFLEYLMMVRACDHDLFEEKVAQPKDLDQARMDMAAQQTQRMQDIGMLLDPEFVAGELKRRGDAEKTAQMLSDRFNYVYAHENLGNLYAKTSVSELKHAAMEEAGVHAEFETERTGDPYVPQFAKETKESGGTDRGSAFHKVLELLDYGKYLQMTDPAMADAEIAVQIENDIAEMVISGRLTQEYADLVPVKKIAGFMRSQAAQRMGRAALAGRLKKEQPFVNTIPASRLHAEIPKEERVMIQGVIDVFWEEGDGVVLLDYKTDHISRPEELTDRYTAQMEYYQEAIEQITGKKVKEKILYSFALMQEIPI